MPILKANLYPKGGFLKISNQFLRGRELSWQAKGLLTFLLSYGESYQHSFAGILKHSKDGEYAVRSTLKELESLGYLSRKMISMPVKSQGAKGNHKQIAWIYTVSETPLKSDTFFNSQSSGFQDVGDQDVGDQDVGDQDVGDQDVGNRDVYNKEVPYKETEITKTTTTVAVATEDFSEEEEKILAWADQHEYWGREGGLSNRPKQARITLDKSGENCLRAQYEKATKASPGATKMAKKVRDDQEAIDACPYCDTSGYLRFDIEAKGITKYSSCDHDAQRIEKFMREKKASCMTKKLFESPKISTNEDEVVTIPMIASMALKKGIK